MLVTNLTSQDIYFGPLHVGPFASNVTIDDTSATSLYLTSDAVADALNNAYISNKIQVSGAADPFPRPTGVPQLLHGDGSPEGVVYAPQGSVFMRRDGLLTNGGVLYLKTTGVTYNSGWLDLATASGAIQAIPAGAISSYGGAAAPAGWLLCDGAAISRTVYSVLYTAIGTNYGAGDGSTTFNLPDLEGRVPVGKEPTPTSTCSANRTESHSRAAGPDINTQWATPATCTRSATPGTRTASPIPATATRPRSPTRAPAARST